MNFLYRCLFGLGSLCFSIHVLAQSANTIGYSSYGGIYNLDFTPVSEGSVFRSDVNLFSLSAWQSMQGAKFFPLMPAENYRHNEFDDINRQLDGNETINGKAVSFDEDFDLSGPSLVLSQGKIGRVRRTFGLTTGVHSWMQCRNLNTGFFSWNDHDFDTSFVLQSKVEMTDVSLRRAVWADYGINYSQTIWNHKAHEVALGATFKAYQALNAFVAHFDHLSATADNQIGGDSILFSIAADRGVILHSESEYLAQDTQKGVVTSANGISFGGDIGFTYSFKPAYKKFQYAMDDTAFTDQSQLNYLVRVGVSVKNIGSLKITNATSEDGLKPAPFRDLNYSFSDKYYEFRDHGLQHFDTDLQSDRWLRRHSFSTKEPESTFALGLPTTLQSFADVNIFKGLGISAQAIVSLNDKNNPMVLRRPDMFQVVPKFETAKRGIYVPLSYNEWSKFSAGFGVRMGSLSIAVSNVMLFDATAPYAHSQVSFGLRVPVVKQRHKDTDEDLISDPLDDCDTQPGPSSAHGCPDADFDGIQDKDDRCKDVFGLPEMSGCPDDDGDGLINSEDGCPTIFGPASGTAKAGCPDADGDGFIDDGITDLCPDKAGHVNGCPDSDGDGVMDDEDKCKNSGGKPELHGADLEEGCPDTDGDDLHDHLDDCDEESGPPENVGCPLYDYDEDKVLDYKDSCQTVFGDPSNDGCPLDEIIAINITESVIYFNDGDVLTADAIKELKEVAKDLSFELHEDPDIKIELMGHAGLTDNAADKQALSLQRAEAVKAFLVAETGLQSVSFYVKGFGDREGALIKAYPTGEFPDRRVEIVLSIPDDK